MVSTTSGRWLGRLGLGRVAGAGGWGGSGWGGWLGRVAWAGGWGGWLGRLGLGRLGLLALLNPRIQCVVNICERGGEKVSWNKNVPCSVFLGGSNSPIGVVLVHLTSIVLYQVTIS